MLFAGEQFCTVLPSVLQQPTSHTQAGGVKKKPHGDTEERRGKLMVAGYGLRSSSEQPVQAFDLSAFRTSLPGSCQVAKVSAFTSQRTVNTGPANERSVSFGPQQDNFDRLQP